MAFFVRVFPDGVAGTDVLKEIAPEGWKNSPLVTCYHPSPKQALAERLRRHRWLQQLRSNRQETDQRDLDPTAEPTLEDVLINWEEHPVNIKEEVTDIVGRCLWDVVSDNNEVIAPDGRTVDLESFRGASTFLSNFVGGFQGGTSNEDEYRFYMGTVLISQRADLTPVYRTIFSRLKSLKADWNYHFPRGDDEEERGRKANLEARTELHEIYLQARCCARNRRLPEIVRAYQDVYGRDPKGWPPEQAGQA